MDMWNRSKTRREDDLTKYSNTRILNEIIIPYNTVNRVIEIETSIVGLNIYTIGCSVIGEKKPLFSDIIFLSGLSRSISEHDRKMIYFYIMLHGQ